jgi:DNA-binding transcriptional LysR family regulator
VEIQLKLIDRVAYRLKLRDLRLLDTVVRSKSMVKAASQLHMSQPAVSKAIAELEYTLGVRLVDRNRQGVEPTPHGRALLRRGAAIFDELRLAVNEMEFLSDSTAGEVRIATSETVSAGLLPVLIARLTRQYPKVSIHVTQSPIGSLQYRTPQYQDLRDRNVDLVLGPIITPMAEDDLVAEPLFGDHVVVAAGSRNPWMRRRKVQLAELIDEPWCLLPHDTVAGSRSIGAFRAHGLNHPARNVVTNSVQLQIGMLATQRYLAMLPSSLVRFSGKRFSIKALPIRLSVSPRVIGIVTLKNRTISPVAQLVIQAARAITKPIAKI